MKVVCRVLAFVSKEIQSIVVQPQLLVLLVAGPFLVLLAFGLGYQARGPDLRTIIVQAEAADPRQSINQYLRAVGPPVHVVEITTDLARALSRLRTYEAELVVQVPSDIHDTLLAGQNVRLVFYHNEIDPALVGYISAVVDGVTSRLNRSLVRFTAGEQQASARDYERILRELQTNLSAIREAMRRGEREQAAGLADVVRLNSALVASLGLFSADALSDPATPPIHLTEQARRLETVLNEPGNEPEAAEQVIAAIEENQ